MKKTLKFIKALSTFSLVIATLLAARTANAWGPERQPLANDQPASYVTFNSIIDNAGIGDERNFVRVREAGTSNAYTDELEIVPGKEYEVYIYYHNNAASNLNPSGKGIANGVKISSAYPTTVKSGERGMVSGIITATDADPASVWDEAYLTTKAAEVNLSYKIGTAIIHNAGRVNGSVLSDSLFTEAGAYIGINVLDGRIPGCAEYSGYITYTLIAESTTSELLKEVSTDGETWSNNVTVAPGDFVTYRITFKNTGNTTLTNVIFKDTHSDTLNLRAGSTKVYDAANTSGKVIDDIIDISGYNVGDVAPGALVQIIYQARVAKNLNDCTTSLSNKISVEYNGAVAQESATGVSLVCAGSITEEEDCKTNPNLPGCASELPDEIVNTGPIEIIMATIVVLSIIAGSIYLWRTRRTLKKVEDEVSGKKSSQN